MTQIMNDHNGVDSRMAGFFQKRGKAATPLLGSRAGPAYGNSWVVFGTAAQAGRNGIVSEGSDVNLLLPRRKLSLELLERPCALLLLNMMPQLLGLSCGG
ncbi:hypothetical protein OIK40_04220 [Erythrobacter sp. sf7]|uniref:Uncharacterized protein n=1 Tax=Erythrobacter fulvus TaxID=2987523 RepID=A0ABT5JM77_9SPHN|nr:hypothetical protein [Erythrobacter fulvus]